MSRCVTRYKVLVDLSIDNGCFSGITDVLKYVKYRLNLRSRESDAVVLNDICLISETNKQEVFNYEKCNDSSVLSDSQG